MDTEFWHRLWESDELGFHQEQANALMVAHFGRLGLGKGSRVFLPLCGKTRDIGWLLSQGYAVVGAELSEIAVRDLFDDLGVEPIVTRHGPLERYRSDGIDIFAGDILDLTAESLGTVDATYDRAALVALPEQTRRDYARHLIEITRSAPQFLICFEYDQMQMEGPPFSVPEQNVTELYANAYAVERVVERIVEGGLKGKCEAMEVAWLLRPR